MRQTIKELLKSYKRHELPISSFLIGFVLVLVFATSFMLYRSGAETPTSEPAGETAQTIEFEVADKTAKSSSQNEVYVVQAGDSSWKLAEKFFGDGEMYPLIESANSLEHDSYLEIGMELVVPKLQAEGSGQHAMAAMPWEAGVMISESRNAINYHVVEVGESLWSIAAEELGDSERWVEIYEMNKLVIGSNPDLIYKYQILVVRY